MARFLWVVEAGEAVNCTCESVSVDHSGRDAAREDDSEISGELPTGVAIVYPDRVRSCGKGVLGIWRGAGGQEVRKAEPL